MSDRILLGGALLGFVILVAFGVWMTTELWGECRADHSWLYCLKVISR